MKKGQIISLVGLIVSILTFTVAPCIIYKNTDIVTGEVGTIALVFALLFLLSIFTGIVFLVLFIVFSVKKKKSADESVADKVDAPEVEKRTLKEGIKRTPWYIWLICIVCGLLGLIFLIIPPLGVALLALGFASFWFPYYSWKKEHIRAAWPSGELTHEKIVGDLRKHRHKTGTINPEDYRIEEDVILSTNADYETDGELGSSLSCTVSFQKLGTHKIQPSKFQKYYSAIEIVGHIEDGEAVYLIISNRTNKIEFVYRKIYCTL